MKKDSKTKAMVEDIIKNIQGPLILHIPVDKLSTFHKTGGKTKASVRFSFPLFFPHSTAGFSTGMCKTAGRRIFFPPVRHIHSTGAFPVFFPDFLRKKGFSTFSRPLLLLLLIITILSFPKERFSFASRIPAKQRDAPSPERFPCGKSYPFGPDSKKARRNTSGRQSRTAEIRQARN